MLLNAGVIASSEVVEPSDLDLTGLLAWYKLDEASGDALDAHSTGRNLTQSGTVGSTTGHVGNARNWPTGDSANYFRSTDTAFVNSNTFYGSGWFYFTDENLCRIMGVGLFSVTDGRWFLQKTSNETIRFSVIRPNESEEVLFSDSISLNTWVFYEWYYNDILEEIGVAINKNSFVTTSIPGGMLSTGSPGSFDVGVLRNVTLSPFIGRMDEITLWNTLPTESRRDYLYNSGAGNTYPG